MESPTRSTFDNDASAYWDRTSDVHSNSFEFDRETAKGDEDKLTPASAALITAIAVADRIDKSSSLRTLPLQSKECCLKVAAQRNTDAVIHPIVAAGARHG